MFWPYRNHVWPSITSRPARAMLFGGLNQNNVKHMSIEFLFFVSCPGHFWPCWFSLENFTALASLEVKLSLVGVPLHSCSLDYSKLLQPCRALIIAHGWNTMIIAWWCIPIKVIEIEIAKFWFRISQVSSITWIQSSLSRQAVLVTCWAPSLISPSLPCT